MSQNKICFFCNQFPITFIDGPSELLYSYLVVVLNIEVLIYLPQILFSKDLLLCQDNCKELRVVDLASLIYRVLRKT